MIIISLMIWELKANQLGSVLPYLTRIFNFLNLPGHSPRLQASPSIPTPLPSVIVRFLCLNPSPQVTEQEDQGSHCSHSGQAGQGCHSVESPWQSWPRPNLGGLSQALVLFDAGTSGQEEKEQGVQGVQGDQPPSTVKQWKI